MEDEYKYYATLLDGETLADAMDSSIQEVYGEYRQAIGDFKMDAHAWQDAGRHVSFAYWLISLAGRVLAEVPRER